MDARNNNDPRNMFFDQRRDFNPNGAGAQKNAKTTGNKEKRKTTRCAYGAANQLHKKSCQIL